jgi:hypothetical protein
MLIVVDIARLMANDEVVLPEEALS